MPRKIYDIKPPKLAREVEQGIREFLGEEKPKIRRSARSKKASPVVSSKKAGRPQWLPIAGAVLVIVLVFGVYLFFKLPKAEIAIWPKVEVLNYQQVVTVNKAVTMVDNAEFAIPAQYLEETKTLSQEFPATGNADDSGKASGTITVFNKSNISYLKAGTRFVSDSGKLFLAVEKIVLAPPKKSGSKIVPGEVTVKVKAAEGGESYNIAPSNFSVPGLKGTADYYNVYATSSAPMSGGYAGKIKKVTDDDIQGAKSALVKMAADEGLAELKSRVPEDYILLDNAVSSVNIEASTAAKAGTVADKFTYKATVKTSAIIFKKSDIDAYAKDYLKSQVSEGKVLLDSSYKLSYSASSVDVSGGKALLSLDFSSGSYKDIDKNSMALSLMGKNASQINAYVSGIMGEEISKIEINFWPFWVAKAPDNQKAIKIDLKF